jgi:hypothetical protein
MFVSFNCAILAISHVPVVIPLFIHGVVLTLMTLKYGRMVISAVNLPLALLVSGMILLINRGKLVSEKKIEQKLEHDWERRREEKNY